jgi:23S rRNA maturation-related 3'-5' exoribonuclease YhaM
MTGSKPKSVKKSNKKIKTRKKRLTLHDKAKLAIKEAVKEVYAQAKKDKRTLATLKDGKVVHIKPWLNKNN